MEPFSGSRLVRIIIEPQVIISRTCASAISRAEHTKEPLTHTLRAQKAAPAPSPANFPLAGCPCSPQSDSACSHIRFLAMSYGAAPLRVNALMTHAVRKIDRNGARAQFKVPRRVDFFPTSTLYDVVVSAAASNVKPMHTKLFTLDYVLHRPTDKER
jgi:hypothetical protein